MSYEVSPEELTAHASHLDGVKDRLNTAISAANTASMSEGAYGLLCAFLPPIVNPTEEKGVNALKAAADGVASMADNVRGTANEYRDSEQKNSESFKSFLRAEEKE